MQLIDLCNLVHCCCIAYCSLLNIVVWCCSLTFWASLRTASLNIVVQCIFEHCCALHSCCSPSHCSLLTTNSAVCWLAPSDSSSEPSNQHDEDTRNHLCLNIFRCATFLQSLWLADQQIRDQIRPVNWCPLSSGPPSQLVPSVNWSIV